VSAHIPAVDPDEDLYIVPDTADGASTNCVCSDCQEARLNDDERITYTAHDVADAWTQGWKTGFAKGKSA
jgi:hypothetical protein